MTSHLSNLQDETVLPATTKPQEASPDFTWREIATFGSLVSVVLLATNAFVCATWSHFFGLPGWSSWQVLPGALAIAFIPATVLRFRSTHPALRALYALSASWLGALNFAFFAAIACWLVAGAAWVLGRPIPHTTVAAILFGLAFLTALYGLLNARMIRVKRITMRWANLPEAWQGRTAALITDLHLGPLSGPGFLRRILARLRTLQPDAVFISGDMFDGPTLGLKELVAPWREFSAPRGIFYVTGNHDEFSERSLYLNPVTDVGIQVLNNEKISVEGLQIVGVHDSEAGNSTQLREILREARIAPGKPSILLAHRPINLAVAEKEGISLQLSGHTHLGQLWPWNLIVRRIYGRFAYGLHQFGKMRVYTSSGVGTWGPPLRVATPSEIVVIRFEKGAT